jgi:light-regulated signal transduction histidine kinase (bacteriophytochrome)
LNAPDPVSSAKFRRAVAVLAEDRRPDLHSFMNHHFPASDIPQ